MKKKNKAEQLFPSSFGRNLWKKTLYFRYLMNFDPQKPFYIPSLIITQFRTSAMIEWYFMTLLLKVSLLIACVNLKKHGLTFCKCKVTPQQLIFIHLQCFLALMCDLPFLNKERKNTHFLHQVTQKALI